jgi:sulfatase maturation enzyme AslB (radical SAM superfamily)
MLSAPAIWRAFRYAPNATTRSDETMKKKRGPSAKANPEQIIARAQALAEAQDIAQAIALLAPLDGTPQADYLRAGLLLLTGHPQTAEALFRRILDTVPGHLDSMVGLAGALVAQGRAVEALPHLEIAAQYQPNSGHVAYLAGVALEEAGHIPASQAQMSKARSLVMAPAIRRQLVPYEIYVQMSRRCNLRCTMCGWEIWKDNSGFMEDAVFDRILAEAKTHSIRTIHILAGQGEPFLHPKAFEMLERAVGQGFDVGIVTNGTPFTPDKIKRLGELGLAYLQFSFAGWDAESYESVYVGAKFERTLANLKSIAQALRGTRTRFAVKAVALGDWQENLRKTKDFLESHGIDQVWTVPANNFGGSVKAGSLHPRHGVWTLKDIDHHRLMPCRLTLKSVGVFVDGTVTACGCYDSNAQLKIGNIMEQGLAEIRQGEAFKAILEGFTKGYVKHIPMCGQCDDPFG